MEKPKDQVQSAIQTAKKALLSLDFASIWMIYIPKKKYMLDTEKNTKEKNTGTFPTTTPPAITPCQHYTMYLAQGRC